MHKLMEYICNELEEYERKADKDGKLSMAEMQYVDLLAHTKKNLLKADEMWEESEYSMAMDGGMSRNGRTYSNRMGSYARGRGRNAKRDSMGRYSSESGYSRYPASYGSEEMMEELRELMQDATDQQTRQEFQRFIQKLEQMR